MKIKKEHLVIILAVTTCICLGLATYYKVKYDRVVRHYEAIIQEATEEIKVMTIEVESEIWSKEKKSKEKQINDRLYDAIKTLVVSLRDDINDNSNVSTHVRLTRLSVLMNSFCSKGTSFKLEEYNYVVGTSVLEREMLLDKIMTEINQCNN